MASLGTSKVRLPRPSFTYTNTLERWPPVAITFSAMLVPLQAGSWLMSILAALGASPSSFTVPLTLAAVAGSIGAAAGVAALGVAAGCSSVDSFFPHPARRMSPQRVGKARIAFQIFVFMLLLHLSSRLKAHKNLNS